MGGIRKWRLFLTDRILGGKSQLWSDDDKNRPLLIDRRPCVRSSFRKCQYRPMCWSRLAFPEEVPAEVNRPAQDLDDTRVGQSRLVSAKEPLPTFHRQGPPSLWRGTRHNRQRESPLGLTKACPKSADYATEGRRLPARKSSNARSTSSRGPQPSSSTTSRQPSTVIRLVNDPPLGGSARRHSRGRVERLLWPANGEANADGVYPRGSAAAARYVCPGSVTRHTHTNTRNTENTRFIMKSVVLRFFYLSPCLPLNRLVVMPTLSDE